ncbi:MAG: hypothetical protein K8I60_12575, partial [Anaerolineae bacterium]|nr:hypothetical protein [Anaerolineae bacterium]
MTDEHTLFARLQEAEADLAAARAHIARLEAQLSLTVTRHEKIESELRLKSAALEAAASGVMITDR